MGVSKDLQNIESIRESFKAGKTIYTMADDGYFHPTVEFPTHEKYPKYKECECCGSKIEDKENIAIKKELFDEYRKEEARLYNLFRQALCEFHDLDIENPKVQKALSIAWERGHANGYYEVAGEFNDLVELLD